MTCELPPDRVIQRVVAESRKGELGLTVLPHAAKPFPVNGVPEVAVSNALQREVTASQRARKSPTLRSGIEPLDCLGLGHGKCHHDAEDVALTTRAARVQSGRPSLASGGGNTAASIP